MTLNGILHRCRSAELKECQRRAKDNRYCALVATRFCHRPREEDTVPRRRCLADRAIDRSQLPFACKRRGYRQNATSYRQSRPFIDNDHIDHRVVDLPNLVRLVRAVIAGTRSCGGFQGSFSSPAGAAEHVESSKRRWMVLRWGRRSPSMRQASCTRSIRARIFGFSFFNQTRLICSAMTRSTLLSTRLAPRGADPDEGARL